jgi:tRNA1(Val) A37 N6-methylase TrmN6
MQADVKSTITDDAALGGRLRLLQPRRGHRFGHDAILLAAAVAARKGDRVVDLGAGVGAVGLALAARLGGVAVALVEVDAALTELATQNIERNRFADRVIAVTLDVAAPARSFAAHGLPAGAADWVMMNPPFHNATRARSSPSPARRVAHLAHADTLSTWVKTAARLLKPAGRLALIYRADGLGEVLASLEGTFGAIEILPIFPRPGAAAIRILVRAIKSSRAPLALRGGLVLGDEAGRSAPAAEAILRDAAALEF